MPVLAALPAGPNLFSSPPPNPRINDPLPANSLPPLPIPARFKKKPPAEPSSPPPPSLPAKPPSLKAVHSRTRYYKPVSEGVLSDDNSGRSVVVGPSGVSYRLPGAPFEFQFSYSETPKVKPLAIREPAFLPFAPPTMNRPWTGKAPLLSKKDKERKKKVRLFEPLGHDADKGDDDERLDDEGGKVLEMAGRPVQLGWYPKDGRSREEILGAPLKRWEVRALVKPYLSKNRQVNLGRDGLTHNMLELIHSHWRRQEVCKVRCRGVPTVDMDNVCHHLEEKTGGKIIYRIGGIVYLFRGRNYNPRTRPKYPVMLWKPATPVYPKLIQEAPEGLTKIEADIFREKGRILLPICKLAKNGIYLNLVKDVRDAFEESELVKVDCQGMHASDYKKLGAKLKDLVPCVLLSFDEEQILMWRGKDWKSRYRGPLCLHTKPKHSKDADSSNLCGSDQSRGSGVESLPGNERFSTKMVSLWKCAVETNKALLLDDTELSPDSLLKRVEDFEGLSQAAEHSYNALIIPSGRDPDDYSEGRLRFGSNDGYSDIDGEFSDGDTYDDDDYDDENDDVYDSLNETDPTIPFGSLPLDSIIEGLAED